MKIIQHGGMRPNGLLFRVIALILILTPIGIHFYYVNAYALNVPRMDDYDAVLKFLTTYKKAPLAEKAGLLFMQHNEHRILLSRIVYVLYYGLQGSINFRSLIFIDFFLLLGIFLVFVAFIKKLLPQVWLTAAAVFSICLFDLNGYENSLFAMAGMQNYGVILLFMASMLCYGLESRRWLPLAALLQMLCIFSSGNGNVASFFLLLYSLGTKDRVKIITCLTTFLLVGPLYYIHYNNARPFFTKDPRLFVPFFFHAIGAYFGFNGGAKVGASMTLLFLVLLPVVRKRPFYSHAALPFICITAFLFVSMGVMSVFRAALPMEASYASRYFIYSNAITALLLLFLMFRLRNKPMIFLITLVCVMLPVVYYAKNFEYGRAGFVKISSDARNNSFDYPAVDVARRIAIDACRYGIYCKENLQPAIPGQ